MVIILLFLAMGSLFSVVILALFAISTENLWHRRFAIAAAAILLAGFGDSIGESIYRLTAGESSYSREAVYEIPNSSAQIVLERRAIHTFLAEYERTLVLRQGTNELIRAAAAVDSGGYSRMNIYEISPNDYFLRGDLSMDRFLLNATHPALIQDFSADIPENARFLGAFDRDEKGWRFIPAHERPERKKLEYSNYSYYAERQIGEASKK